MSFNGIAGLRVRSDGDPLTCLYCGRVPTGNYDNCDYCGALVRRGWRIDVTRVEDAKRRYIEVEE
jgi:hypothetical protein